MLTEPLDATLQSLSVTTYIAHLYLYQATAWAPDLSRRLFVALCRCTTAPQCLAASSLGYTKCRKSLRAFQLMYVQGKSCLSRAVCFNQPYKVYWCNSCYIWHVCRRNYHLIAMQRVNMSWWCLHQEEEGCKRQRLEGQGCQEAREGLLVGTGLSHSSGTDSPILVRRGVEQS